MFARYASILFTLASIVLPVAAQTPGSVTGQITDATGSSVPAASVSVLKAGAIVKTAQTNEQGVFTIASVPPGNYTLHVAHIGFNPIDTKLPLTAGQRATFNTQLILATAAQSVTVQADAGAGVSVDASQNAGALILKQAEIDALPDDPDDLASDLAQLAGPTAGPNGGQIYIDGFTGGRLPPKESIREIRINQNPYSAEYDQLGYGRIEILTKPGSDKFHGSAFLNDSDGVFNARNPLLESSIVPDFSSRQFGGNVTGALNKKTSFYFDVEQRDIDDNGIVVASILDPTSLAITKLSTFQAEPQRRTDLSPRIDYQLNTNNTLVVKYNFLHNTIQDSGVGQLDLASQGTNTSGYEHSVQVTETAVLSPSMINETRFRYLRDLQTDKAATPGTEINVSGAFIGGGSPTATSNTDLTNLELQNYTSITKGIQAIKFGLRIRSYQYSQTTPTNFLGTFTFAGGPAAVLGAGNVPETNPDGTYVTATVSSIQQYQTAQLLLAEGLPISQLTKLGYAPSQFSINTGDPKASIAELDAGLFFQDDVRLRPNLTVNFGLRYEIQNQISDFTDFAPRFGFAWSPDSKGGKQGKTVIRGGSGFFYTRFAYNYSLNTEVFNGRTIQQYIIDNPTFYPNIPTAAQLQGFAVPQTIDQADAHLRAPYIVQTAIGIERALPKSTRIAVNYLNSRGVHQYRTVNINAPDPYLDNLQPYGAAAGNIYNYESDGIFKQEQLIVSVNTSFVPAVSLFSFFTVQTVHSNTDGIGTFPSNQYNFSDEYSRAAFDARYRAFVGGSVTVRYGVRLSPFIVYRSSLPFNITSGDDYLDTTLFNERPSFTTLPCTTTGVVCTSYGNFSVTPQAGETVIPRNFGNGPSLFSVNIRVSKTFGFGERASGYRNTSNSGGGGGGPRGGGPGGPFGGGGGGRGGPGGMFGDSLTSHKYNLTLTAQARNLFNNVNLANPIGAITSPLFGQSLALAQMGPGGSNTDNRRLEFGIRFSF